MSGTYNDLVGTWGYSAGASGTVTIAAGAKVIQIIVHSTAAGTMTIFGGASIPIIATAQPVAFRFIHTLVQATAAAQTIVFTGTDSYFIEWVR